MKSLFLRVTLTLALLAAGLTAFAQSTVKGTVKDAAGEAVIGAAVQVAGTANGAITDVDGSFTLPGVRQGDVLEISCIGYATQNYTWNGGAVNVILEEDALMLEGTVVTALGITREKKTLGYAIQDVKGDALLESRESNLANALTGKVAGVSIVRSSNGPGASSRIVLRGNSSLTGLNQPLIVIDGVPMDNFTGALCGREVVVYDGSQLLNLNLDHISEGWKSSDEVHGQKLGQPVSGCIDGDFCTWGGSTARTAEREAKLRLSGYRYGAKPIELKTPVDESGNPIFLGGAAAVNLSDSVVLAVGGVNKDIFLEAVNHPKPGYMTHPIAWYQFNPYVFVYDREGWHLIGRSDITARAGAALVRHNNDVYLVGGELKPGIRTADIYRMTFTY